MIIPSIDIMNGQAVQLRRGEEHLLDGGDPLQRLDEMAVAGEVAVVDLDAALGRGSNAEIIRKMVQRARCRVGGGIRDLDAARAWLDAGAETIVVGTAAQPDFCAELPRERLIAAVDCRHGSVVVEGWRTKTGENPISKIGELRHLVGGFLLTQVEHEGCLAGFDFGLVQTAVDAAGNARVTAAGGITSVDEIGRLAAIGADAQIGMALYSGRLSLGDGFAASLDKGIAWQPDRETPTTDVWPTVVCDEYGSALGLVWSTRESLAAAINERHGVYWSRSRNALWRKGETSGNTQDLIRVDLDCDRDALRFVVRQTNGFCHTGERGCWSETFTLASLERILEARRESGQDSGSGTARLLADPALLAAKLSEESGELAAAESRSDIAHEAADLLYFTLVTAARGGVPLAEIERELELRNLRLTRRPMAAKQRRENENP
jgi:phosphoribosyl-ATP pyrophosphohydrolase